MSAGILFHWSPKGGSGTSVVAAGTAIRLARDGADVVLVDCDGDQASPAAGPPTMSSDATAQPAEPPTEPAPELRTGRIRERMMLWR